jgi:hypothetical protein
MKPLEEGEFTEMIQHKYMDYFSHLFVLHQLAASSLQSFLGKIDNHHQATCSLVFGRAFKSFDSIRRLCMVASTEDASILLRSLLNLVVITRWISIDQSARSQRYLEYYWFSLKEKAEKYPGFASKERMKEINANYERVRHHFEWRDSKGKLQTAKTWYQPAANTLRDMFAEVDMEDHYDGAYSPLSSIEHSDAHAFAQMLPGLRTATGTTNLKLHQDVMIPSILRNAFQYFAEIFALCNCAIPLADQDQLNGIRKEGFNFFQMHLSE